MLHKLNVKIYSTGGTFTFINELGIAAEKVEDLTGFPSILGGALRHCTLRFSEGYWPEETINQTWNNYRNTRSLK